MNKSWRNKDLIDSDFFDFRERSDLQAVISRKDRIISRLKEDAERLAKKYVIEAYPGEWVCRGCYNSARLDAGAIKHASDCPITLHRALMKKLEGK